MKNIFLITLLLISSIVLSQENEFNVGINGGITNGNIKNIASGALGLDANYLFDIVDDVKFGPAVNVLYFFTKENNNIKPDPFIYLPIGGAVRFHGIGEKFNVGADIGYAIGISPSGDRGGIFFKPMLGYDITEKLSLNIFYAGVKKKQPTYSYLGLGIVFNVFGKDNYYTF